MTQKQDPNLVNLVAPAVSQVAPVIPKQADKSKRAQNLRANMLKRKEQMAARSRESAQKQN
jgi:hypothetical protein